MKPPKPERRVGYSWRLAEWRGRCEKLKPIMTIVFLPEQLAIFGRPSEQEKSLSFWGPKGRDGSKAPLNRFNYFTAWAFASSN